MIRGGRVRVTYLRLLHAFVPSARPPFPPPPPPLSSRSHSATAMEPASDPAAASDPVAADPPADNAQLSPPPVLEDVDHGFQRPEMNSSPLAGTVDAYDCHLFLCYKSPESWPAKVEGHDADLLPRFFAAALKSRKNDLPRNIRFTVCEGSDGTEFPNGAVLMFPDTLRYMGLTPSNVDKFVEDVLVRGENWDAGTEALTGSFVFVCAHGSRDKRCGVCGPVLVKKFQEEVESKGMKYQVSVSPCSHVGGHKYAGNVIIFTSLDGSVAGHWYGYVTPEDVPVLLDRQIVNGEIVDRLWRGQMGMSSEDQKIAHEKRLQGSREELSVDDSSALQNGKERLLDSNNNDLVLEGTAIENKENGTSCCQGANGFTCCREQPLENDVGSIVNADGYISKPKNGGSCKVKTWLQAWDQSDTLLALGVIGVAASVAVAYTIYRRSG